MTLTSHGLHFKFKNFTASVVTGAGDPLFQTFKGVLFHFITGAANC